MIGNVLVTGGTGFVGKWMQYAQPINLKVTYLNRIEYKKYKWVNENFDYIVHLANIDPVEVLRHSHLAKILYCSSGAAYDQTTQYADNKRQWEYKCVTSGLQVVIARLFTFYGDGLDEEKAISQFIHSAKLNEPIVVYNNDTIRSYMHGKELGAWMWSILIHGKNGETYDVGSDTPINMLQLAKAVKIKYNSNSEIISANIPSPCPYYMPRDTNKTKGLL